MGAHDVSWTPPPVDADSLILGDMPGDQIRIDQSHIDRADAAFPVVLQKLSAGDTGKLVVSVYGGSGVGKSEIGSILAFYCREAGYPAYLMSGDNYPRRCPPHNDAERLNRFRAAGLAAAAALEDFTDEWNRDILASWPALADADPSLAENHRGFRLYQSEGRNALEKYLGTEIEIDFAMVNSIIRRFKDGKARIALKRMGRTPEDISYQSVDFSSTRILIVEWTHGNNPLLQGVDIPIFLYSSPEQTLEHRLARGRDENTDSSFVQMVLEFEQSRLNSQASSAALILGKDASVIPGDNFPKAPV